VKCDKNPFLGWEKDNMCKLAFLTRLTLQKSAVILAGGFSKRFGTDKGLVSLIGKPLVCHVIDNVHPAVDEVLVVTSSETQKQTFEPVVKNSAKLIIDEDDSQSPLVGAITGFKYAQGEYTMLLPVDAPLVSIKLVDFLLDLSNHKQAVIPRWPTGLVEPLIAVYQTKPALTAAKDALQQGHRDMLSMIANLRQVRYVSTMVLEHVDPQLVSFFNINTPLDLKQAESLVK
jgi:molybdopterin-guanine dinucleotide biosynthesis protein A